MSGTPQQPGPAARRPSPIERFLGPAEVGGGPFALLGVSPQSCTDETVLAALERQLDRVAHHIECDTPEADEVRLALHAAAAQLLDPAVRRHLTARWLGRTPPPAPRPATEARSGTLLRRTPSELLLEHDAVLTLGMFGGWNRGSLRRLVVLAHARGLSSEQVARTLHNLSTRRRPRAGSVSVGRLRKPAAPGRPTGAPRPAHAGDNVPLAEQIDPAQALLRNFLIFAAVGVIGLGVLIALVVRLLAQDAPGAPGPSPTPTVTPAGQGTSTPPEVQPAPAPGAQVPPKRSGQAGGTGTGQATELSDALREIGASSAALEVDPQAATARFEHAVAVLGAGWCTAPRDRLVAAHDAIVEFLYRVGADEALTKRALAAVGAGAEALTPGSSAAAWDGDRVWPAVWSLGMLVRLSREKDLAATTRDGIESRIGAAVGHARPVIERGFESGANAALLALPAAMLSGASSPTIGAWTQWARAAEAVALSDTTARDAVLLAGLDALVILGPEPNADRSVLEAVGELVPRVSWREGDPGRARLLRWFDDRRVTSADLQAVTSALATRSGAEGVDLTMVLSSAASERVRADLRDRYARLWKIADAVDRGIIAAEWAEAARAAVERSHAASSPVEHLAAAAVLARVNEAAWRLWKGDTPEAARILGGLADDIDAILQPAPAAGSLGDPGGDGGWAERYLATRRNVPLRLELLTRLSSRAGALGPVDAEALAAEALSGSPAEVRARAAELVRQFAHSPAMVNAVLEALPRAARVIQNGALIAYVGQTRLPGIRDPAWPMEARRALVDRLLELTAAAGDHAAIDQLSRSVALAYRGLASEVPLTAAERTGSAQPPAHESAAVVRARWREAASKSNPGPRSASGPDLAELDRRHAGRVGVARGLVQEFAAEQVGACELMAYVVGAEQPAGAEGVREALAEMSERRRSSRHILEQLNAVERATIQLWLARAPETPA